MMPAKRSIFAVALCGLIVVSSCLCAFSEEIKTYEEWCAKLDGLHREREAIPEFEVSWYEMGPWTIGTILCAAFMVASELSEDFRSKVNFAILSILPAIIGGWVSVARATESRPAQKEIATLTEEIATLTQASANRMWFYPRVTQTTSEPKLISEPDAPSEPHVPFIVGFVAMCGLILLIAIADQPT